MNWLYHLVTLGFLVAALAAYAAAPVVSGLLLLVGLVCEGAFWMRLLRRNSGSRNHPA